MALKRVQGVPLAQKLGGYAKQLVLEDAPAAWRLAATRDAWPRP